MTTAVTAQAIEFADRAATAYRRAAAWQAIATDTGLPKTERARTIRNMRANQSRATGHARQADQLLAGTPGR